MKKISLWILSILVVLIIGIIIYTVISNNTKESEEKVIDTRIITDKCTYEVTMEQFNNKRELEECEIGLTKYIITDSLFNISIVTSVDNKVDEEKVGVFFNDVLKIKTKETTNEGETLFNEVKLYKNKSRQYISTFNGEETGGKLNVFVFDKEQGKLYELNEALKENKLEDPVTNENLSKSNKTKTITVDKDGFGFNTTIGSGKCKTEFNTASFKVIFKGNTPEELKLIDKSQFGC